MTSLRQKIELQNEIGKRCEHLLSRHVLGLNYGIDWREMLGKVHSRVGEVRAQVMHTVAVRIEPTLLILEQRLETVSK